MAIVIAGILAETALEGIHEIIGVIRWARSKFGPDAFVEESLLRLGIRYPFLTAPEVAQLFTFALQGMDSAAALFGGSANAMQAASMAPINTLLFGGGAGGRRFLYRAVLDLTLQATGRQQIASLDVTSSVPLSKREVGEMAKQDAQPEEGPPQTPPGAQADDLVTVIIVGIDFLIKSF